MDQIAAPTKAQLIWRRIGFYLLSFTWGIIMSCVGLLVIAVLACFKHVHVWHGRLYGVIGRNWGGLELGCFFIVCQTCIDSDHVCGHESGHGLQNCLWGPLFIFVIFLPSAIRYWYRELKYNRKNIQPPTPYDDIWFEGQATRWGTTYVNTDIL